ncbi:MAG: sugar transferase [Caulobacteraceae bacterium]
MSDHVLADEAISGPAPLRAKRKIEQDQVVSLAHAMVALAILLVILPLLLIVTATIFFSDGGPVIFAHRRVGRGGRTFKCLKFRTMAKDAEARLSELLERDEAAREEWTRDHKLRRDPRVTALGAILRRSSLDELPQFWNVVRGEMRLVGPRPIVSAEIGRYGRRIRAYYAVKPGITGLWQVSGRNDVDYRTRVAMDCLYARKRSLLLDAWLIVRTAPAVLLRHGSY